MRVSHNTLQHQPSHGPLPFILALCILVPLFVAGCGSENSAEPGQGSGGTSGTFVTGWGGAGAAGIGAAGKGTGGTGVAGKATGGTGVAGKGTGGRGAAGTGVAGSVAAGTGGRTAGGAGGSTGAAGTCANFSFFVTSLAAMRRESGSQNGFGGNLNGLAGADDLCRRIAEGSLPCAGKKVWKAFLSTSTEDAIDRVGPGPWYDRRGRVVALKTADLANTRPANADPTIANDLPNEDGVPNHNPDGTGQVDNHDTLTGSNGQGRYVGSASGTCNDWTSVGSGSPQIGHSWPGGPSQNWINGHTAPGCAAGVSLSNKGMGSGSCVGCSGGYGGIYCFATTP